MTAGVADDAVGVIVGDLLTASERWGEGLRGRYPERRSYPGKVLLA